MTRWKIRKRDRRWWQAMGTVLFGLALIGSATDWAVGWVTFAGSVLVWLGVEFAYDAGAKLGARRWGDR